MIKSRTLFVFLFLILFLSSLWGEDLFVSPEVEKQFMEDLAGLLPGIGDLMTIKDILVAIYNGDYDKAVETAAQKKIEDKNL